MEILTNLNLILFFCLVGFLFLLGFFICKACFRRSERIFDAKAKAVICLSDQLFQLISKIIDSRCMDEYHGEAITTESPSKNQMIKDLIDRRFKYLENIESNISLKDISVKDLSSLFSKEYESVFKLISQIDEAKE